MNTLSLRLTRRLRRFLLLAAALIIPAAAGAAPAQAAPASESEMSLYTRIAAVNVCIARGAKVEFDKAASIAGETIAQLIMGQHNGQIQQVGTKALTIEELRRGSVNSAVIGAVELCPKEVPPDVVKAFWPAVRLSNWTAPDALFVAVAVWLMYPLCLAPYAAAPMVCVPMFQPLWLAPYAKLISFM